MKPPLAKNIKLDSNPPAKSSPLVKAKRESRPLRPAERWSNGKGLSTKDASGSILNSIFRAPELREKAGQYAAFPYWEQIVGPQIAAVSKPEKINRGRVLVIRVLDAVYAQELSLMKDKIIDDMFKFGKGALIEDIKFSIGSPRDFAKDKK